MNASQSPRRSRAQGTPATWFLLAANVLVWLAMEASGGSENLANLLRFGAKYGPAIADGEYWRLLTPVFLHIGFFHLLTNAIGLVIFGRIVESGFGTRSFLVVYIMAGVFGNLASYAATPNVGAGASGAIFGIVGAFGAYLLANRANLGATAKNSLVGLAFIVIINFGFGLSLGAVDNWAHLGGLASGFLLGLWLTPRSRFVPVFGMDGLPLGYARHVLTQASASRLLQAIAASLVAAVLVAFVVGRDYPYPERAVGAQTIRVSPSDDRLAVLYLARGLSLAEEDHRREAIQSLERAIDFGLSEHNAEIARRALDALRARRR